MCDVSHGENSTGNTAWWMFSRGSEPVPVFVCLPDMLAFMLAFMLVFMLAFSRLNDIRRLTSI